MEGKEVKDVGEEEVQEEQKQQWQQHKLLLHCLGYIAEEATQNSVQKPFNNLGYNAGERSQMRRPVIPFQVSR